MRWFRFKDPADLGAFGQENPTPVTTVTFEQPKPRAISVARPAYPRTVQAPKSPRSWTVPHTLMPPKPRDPAKPKKEDAPLVSYHRNPYYVEPQEQVAALESPLRPGMHYEPKARVHTPIVPPPQEVTTRAVPLRLKDEGVIARRRRLRDHIKKLNKRLDKKLPEPVVDLIKNDLFASYTLLHEIERLPLKRKLPAEQFVESEDDLFWPQQTYGIPRNPLEDIQMREGLAKAQTRQISSLVEKLKKEYEKTGDPKLLADAERVLQESWQPAYRALKRIWDEWREAEAQPQTQPPMTMDWIP